jgi:hypothetical protein
MDSHSYLLIHLISNTRINFHFCEVLLYIVLISVSRLFFVCAGSLCLQLSGVLVGENWYYTTHKSILITNIFIDIQLQC